MLDDAKQVAAFKLLQSSGTRAAHSVAVTGALVDPAKNKAEALTTAITPPAGATYPAQVTQMVTLIRGFITALTNASNTGKDFHEVFFEKCDSIHTLVNLSIGFDCYVKANNLPASTPFPLVTGVSNTTEVDALTAAVNALDTAAIVAAMGAINTTLSTTGGTTSTGAAAPTPTVSAAQITALQTAVGAQTAHSTAIVSATGPVVTLKNNAAAAFQQAHQAFDDAVEVALIVALKSDARMAAAINALVPANVLAALN